MVKDNRACLRSCTFGKGLYADARGLMQASNSIGVLLLSVDLKGKLIVEVAVASTMNVG